MKTFKEYLEEQLEEGNKLWRNVEKPLSQGKEVGTVSYERGGMTKKTKAAARKNMEADLQRLRKSGAIGGYKKASGRYQYAEPGEGESGVAKEKSYVVKQGEGKKARHFSKVLKALGNKYGQESTLRVKKDKSAEYQYNTGKVDKIGKVVYNRKLEKGGGDTTLGGQSFTTKE